MNRFINNSCIKYGLNPEFYGAHGFRAGACTDMKLKGIDDTIIQKRGRWGSEVWKKHYLLLNLFDVLRLSRC